MEEEAQEGGDGGEGSSEGLDKTFVRCRWDGMKDVTNDYAREPGGGTTG